MNKKEWRVATTTFISLQVIFAFLAWVSGYNFDERNSMVGLFVFYAIFIGGVMSVLVATGLRDD